MNAWYLIAIAASLPGLVLHFGSALWHNLFGTPWGDYVWASAVPVLAIAALACAMVAVLGFLNRRRQLDGLAAAGLAAYAIILATLAVGQGMFIVAFSE